MMLRQFRIAAAAIAARSRAARLRHQGSAVSAARAAACDTGCAGAAGTAAGEHHRTDAADNATAARQSGTRREQALSAFALPRRRALRRGRAAVRDRRRSSARPATSIRAPRWKAPTASSTRRSPACRTSSATRSRPTPTSPCSTSSRAWAAASTSCPAASSRACSRPAAIPRKVVFSGVGKTEARDAAALAAGILCFNVESAAELERLDAVAADAGRRAPVSLRVNPDVDPQTHPYIATGLKESKFGVAVRRCARALPPRGADAASSRCTASTSTSARRSPSSRRIARRRQKMLDLVDRAAPPTASRSRTSTWAAGSASAIATRHRCALSDYAAMVRDALRGPPRTVAVRARPPAGRRRRRAADARRIPEAGRRRRASRSSTRR